MWKCYTYARACIEGARRKLCSAEIDGLWPILVDLSGKPLLIFIHGNVTEREKPILRMKITQCGGMRESDVEKCSIILVERSFGEDEDDVYSILRAKHASNPFMRVEMPSWIDECILKRRLVQNQHTTKHRSGMRQHTYACTQLAVIDLGLNTYSNSRTQRPNPFTPDDDEHLVEYLGAPSQSSYQ